MLKLPTKMKSYNISSCRRCGFKLQAYKREFDEDIKRALMFKNRDTEYKDKFRCVKITSYRSRFLDEQDNLRYGIKALMDALKWNKLIVDDNPIWCKVTVEQIKCKRKEERTEVRIV